MCRGTFGSSARSCGDFAEEYDPGTAPFEELYVDNTRYTGGQSFMLE